MYNVKYTYIYLHNQKFGIDKIFFLVGINTFIQQGRTKLTKSHLWHFVMLQKISISNKCMFSFIH